MEGSKYLSNFMKLAYGMQQIIILPDFISSASVVLCKTDGVLLFCGIGHSKENSIDLTRIFPLYSGKP